MPLTFDPSHSSAFLPADWFSSRQERLSKAQQQLEDRSGPGGDYCGWVSLPEMVGANDLLRLKAAAAQIRAQSDALVVIGIGGSYLGARAVLELLRSPNHNLLDRPQIFFAGNSLSADSWQELRSLLQGKDITLNVISKSGTTIETSAAYLLLYHLMAERYDPEQLRQRIFVTTDPQQGALRALANEHGFTCFDIPPDIGGRYSVLTPVGLLPLAVAGVNIDSLLSGALHMRQSLRQPAADHPAFLYAAARCALYEQGKAVELLVSYEPAFRCFGEWWKQLFGESEGKQGHGLFPATAEFCADLHSMGQYIQDGARILFETVVTFAEDRASAPLPPPIDQTQALLRGRDLHTLAQEAFRGTLLAHVDGGVPNLLLGLSGRTEEDVGRLIYFFQYACALSAYLLGLNPFDQPGVEAYKRNMRALLGEAGLEQERDALLQRLH